jgi:hypothetical protein
MQNWRENEPLKCFSISFSDVIQKVAFHTGILEAELFALLGKISIQVFA